MLAEELKCETCLGFKPALTVWKELKFETHFGFQGALRSLNEGENLDPSWVLRVFWPSRDLSSG